MFHKFVNIYRSDLKPFNKSRMFQYRSQQMRCVPRVSVSHLAPRALTGNASVTAAGNWWISIQMKFVHQASTMILYPNS